MSSLLESCHTKDFFPSWKDHWIQIFLDFALCKIYWFLAPWLMGLFVVKESFFFNGRFSTNKHLVSLWIFMWRAKSNTWEPHSAQMSSFCFMVNKKKEILIIFFQYFFYTLKKFYKSYLNINAWQKIKGR